VATGGTATGAGSVPLATAPFTPVFHVFADLFLSQLPQPQGNVPASLPNSLPRVNDPFSTDLDYIAEGIIDLTVAHQDAVFAHDYLFDRADWLEQGELRGQ
jgi:hypothetical protein